VPKVLMNSCLRTFLFSPYFLCGFSERLKLGRTVRHVTYPETTAILVSLSCFVRISAEYLNNHFP
jgi:hypothetical protein